MNLSMVVPYYKPEITAIVHLMEDLAYDFGEYGANVTIITGYPLRGTNKAVRKEYSQRKEEQITDNIKILRVGVKTEEGNNLVVRTIRYIYQVFCFYNKAKKVATDVYYIYSTPPFMGVIGGFLSRKAPTLYSLQDIFPDNLFAQRKIKKNGLLHKVLKNMEAYIYRKNNHIVTISKDMKNNLIGKGVNESKISIIENWIDTDEMRYIPREHNPLFKKLELDKDGFYVSYSGNLGYSQDIDIILDSAKLMLERKPDIQFLIIGNGVCKDKIENRIKNEELQNIRLLPLQPEKDAALVYSLGDIGLVTLKKEMHGCAMPSKTWAMMSASQPIICTAAEKTRLYEIIEGADAGITIEPGDYYALTEHIIDLYNRRDRLKAYGVSGRAYAEKYLYRKKSTKEYYKLALKLTEKRDR